MVIQVIFVVVIIFGVGCALAPAKARILLLRLAMRATSNRPPVTTERTAFERELDIYAADPKQYNSKYKALVDGMRLGGVFFILFGIFALWYFGLDPLS